MPISVNTGSGAYSVNASRVEKFMKAENRDQALHMGAWDKFKDLFRTGDDKKAVLIAKIYDSIVSAEPSQEYPVGMAERFKRLRDMATDESKPQFSMQSSKDDRTGLWSYSLSIGSDRILERQGLQDTHHDSFESFSNYKKYFDGVDTVAPPPQSVTNTPHRQAWRATTTEAESLSDRSRRKRQAEVTARQAKPNQPKRHCLSRKTAAIRRRGMLRVRQSVRATTSAQGLVPGTDASEFAPQNQEWGLGKATSPPGSTSPTGSPDAWAAWQFGRCQATVQAPK